MSEFETDRLILRPWHPNDVDFVFDLYSRWEVQRYIGRVPRVMQHRSEAVSRLESMMGHDDPVTGRWAVGVKDAGKLVGTVILKPIPASGETEPLQPSGDIEIGWHFHPDSWGNGFAAEAASVVLDHALRSGLEQVVAVTAPENHASQRVCERIGMEGRGPTAKYYNQVCELFVRMTLRSEPRAAASVAARGTRFSTSSSTDPAVCAT